MAERKIRYAVVGLGHIAQVAVLPAFRRAGVNSILAALVSGDKNKLRKFGDQYDVPQRVTYDEYDELLAGGDVDAVYIALPNHQHADFTMRAARAGVHVLCEKPMAVTERECYEMIRVCDDNGVKLMIAYRLHFEPANISATEVVTSGRLGEPRLFNSVFSMDVPGGDIRLRRETGGGTLYDIGIYCINAARHLFEGEPIEVLGITASRDEERFAAVEEMMSATLRFPNEQIASFVCSFGGSDVGRYQVVGTKGDFNVDPAYHYALDLAYELTIDEKTTRRKFPKRDQFAPELLYFSNCIRDNLTPEPSGWEGLADVRVIEALYRSAQTGAPVWIEPQ